MKEIKFYRTYSYGGPEEKSMEKRAFETVDLAKNDAYEDVKNMDFMLFEVTMVFDGKITETEKYLGKLVCGRDLKRFEETIASKRM